MVSAMPYFSAIILMTVLNLDWNYLTNLSWLYQAAPVLPIVTAVNVAGAAVGKYLWDVT